jgi:FKBP12-rapamycin complex-associated protein
MVCRLGSSYTPYIIPVRRKLSSIPSRDNNKLPQLEEYENLVTRLLKQRPLPHEPSEFFEITMKGVSGTTVSGSGNSGSISVGFSDDQFQPNMQSLETAWALAKRNNASDLTAWMRRLSIELIRQSPSPIIRPCVSLAKTYPPLAEQLFNAAFHCLWEELYGGEYSLDIAEDIPLINGIEMVGFAVLKLCNILILLILFLCMLLV